LGQVLLDRRAIGHLVELKSFVIDIHGFQEVLCAIAIGTVAFRKDLELN
jgi:hypothetical protein